MHLVCITLLDDNTFFVVGYSCWQICQCLINGQFVIDLVPVLFLEQMKVEVADKDRVALELLTLGLPKHLKSGLELFHAHFSRIKRLEVGASHNQMEGGAWLGEDQLPTHHGNEVALVVLAGVPRENHGAVPADVIRASGSTLSV